MCGIAGVVAFSEEGKKSFPGIEAAIQCLYKRGPDANGIFAHKNVLLAHSRLSIIDTSLAASQPMTDATGRYTIVFNGEFFNFKDHREFVLQNGISLKSGSDTEVLLYLYILEKEKCLERINGFFSLAIYDQQEEVLFLARDRFGVKPLLVYHDSDRFLFASEMKALLELDIPRELDEASLFAYFQLNYIPGPDSVFKNVKKLAPGHFMKIETGSRKQEIQNNEYYRIPFPSSQYISTTSSLSYQDQQKKFVDLLDASVQRRLIADVPLGAFLSGGIDSSVVVALASQHTPHLKTFSIGFKDEPLFDETHFANLVAKKFNTDHTVFSLTTDDLLANFFEVLDYIDEPFADSSALPVYILSKQTRKHVTVALSGDGADELFGGYNKHSAEVRVRTDDPLARAMKVLHPLWKVLPQSRNSTAGNRIRQFNRFAEGMKLTSKERYWRWAGVESEKNAESIFSRISSQSKSDYQKRKTVILDHVGKTNSLNDVLYTDMHLVLPNDMLTKVDLMSMANSLEVRTPFLDYEVVNYAFSLPLSSKIDRDGRKKIVRDAFRNILPPELYNRNKQGFEVPLLKWFRKELKSLITDDLLSEKLLREQNIFNHDAVSQLKKELFSSNPGSSVERIWALIVFQYWWKRIMRA